MELRLNFVQCIRISNCVYENRNALHGELIIGLNNLAYETRCQWFQHHNQHHTDSIQHTDSAIVHTMIQLHISPTRLNSTRDLAIIHTMIQLHISAARRLNTGLCITYTKTGLYMELNIGLDNRIYDNSTPHWAQHWSLLSCIQW
jgi:hypothetical protein